MSLYFCYLYFTSYFYCVYFSSYFQSYKLILRQIRNLYFFISVEFYYLPFKKFLKSTCIFFRLLFAILPKFRRSFSYHKLICSTIQDCITKIESSYDENYPTCIVESYFKERNERRRKNDPTWKYFTGNIIKLYIKYLYPFLQ